MSEAATATKPSTTPAIDATAAQVEQTLTDGFHLVIDALKLNGLNTIYGVPGIPITDLGRMAQAEGIRVISFRHEQNAGNAAAIAGFLTKKPGICLTVSAPGFLNGLTALANATTNCFPMILISGSSEREIVDLQQGDYEEMDQLAIARPVAKAAYRVLHAEDIGVGIARAIRAAVSGRPGGVYLDLPAKLFAQSMDAEKGRQSLIKVVDPAPRQIPAPDAVKRALDLLKSAKKPLILLGKGAAYAQADAQIRELVERTGIPYLPMSMAKGLLPDTHEQCASAARSFVLPGADVVLMIGARLNLNALADTSPDKTETESTPPAGLEFLKPYPKLHGLSVDMTDSQFLKIVKQHDLKSRTTVEAGKATHHVALGDDHTLVVMFDQNGKCSGIQRVRGESDDANDPVTVSPLPRGKESQSLFRKWQRTGRTNGDIPGGTIRPLVRVMTNFVKNNPTHEGSPKFAELLSTLGVNPPTKISAATGKETYAFSKTEIGRAHV